jgi:hypothetical protein
MPGIIEVKITDISAKIRPLIKSTGITRIISGECTSLKSDITIMIIVP